MKANKDYNSINNSLLENKTKENIELLVINNQSIVNYLVKKYIPRIKKLTTISVEDLYSEANLALYEAILSYDLKTAKYAFSTTIYYEILKKLNSLYLNNKGVCKISSKINNEIKRIKKYKKQYFDKNYKEPSDLQICKELKISLESLRRIQTLTNPPASLNADAYSNYETEDLIELQETIPNDCPDIQAIIESKEMPEKLKYIIENTNLTKKEQEFIIDAFGLFNRKRLIYKELGKKYNISEEAVRRRINEIIEIIKDNTIIKAYSDLVDKNISNRNDLGCCKKNRNNSYNLFEKYCSFSYNEIIKAVGKLPHDQQQLLYKRFGPNLDKRISQTKINNAENQILFQKTYRILNHYLNNPNYTYNPTTEKTFFERFKGNTEQEIKRAIYDLPKEHQNIIYERYGKNFNELNDISSQSKSLITKTIIPQIKNIIERDKLEDEKRYCERLINEENIDYTEFSNILGKDLFQIYLDKLYEDDRKLLIYAIEGNKNIKQIEAQYGKEVVKEAIACLIYGYYRFLQSHREKIESHSYNERERKRRELEKIIVKVLK